MAGRSDRDGKGERAARLAERLRENLKRRKAQARSRRSGEADPRDGLGATGEPIVNSPESDEDDGRT